MIHIVCATIHSRKSFRSRTPLGRSFSRLDQTEKIRLKVLYDNGGDKPAGLPDFYNRCIAEADDEILVFMHDDVWIEDYYLGIRVLEALDVYDVVGVAGNRRIAENHRGWCFRDLRDGKLIRDSKKYLSGACAGGKKPFSEVWHYGPAPAACRLLDGVFMAARATTLKDAAVRFDPMFPFHFYDLDFCRSAHRAGLKLGTWPIALGHRSEGHYRSPAWNIAFAQYRNKWRPK